MSHIETVVRSDKSIDLSLRAILGFDEAFLFDFRVDAGLDFNSAQAKCYPTYPSPRYAAEWWAAFVNQWYVYDEHLIKAGILVRHKGNHGLSQAGLHYINMHNARLFVPESNVLMVSWHYEFLKSFTQTHGKETSCKAITH